VTDDLAAWLRERLDEDQQAATAATPGPWTVAGQATTETVPANSERLRKHEDAPPPAEASDGASRCPDLTGIRRGEFVSTFKGVTVPVTR
jgi:Family of unknown function (DUF6221)